MDRIASANTGLDANGHRIRVPVNLAAGTPGTSISSAYENALQEELIGGLIEWAGLTPNAASERQIQQALQIMFASSQFQSPLPGSVVRSLLSKLEDIVSIVDFGTLAAADTSGETIYIPAGTYPIISSITLTGHYRFAKGALLQPAAGVVVTFSNAIIDANEYLHIFDLSQGGSFAGKILDTTYSACWFGLDPTGVGASGANLQAAFTAALSPTCRLPYGTYTCDDAPVLSNGEKLYLHNLSLHGGKVDGRYAPQSTIQFKVDAGSSVCGVALSGVGMVENINFAGPSGNASVPLGSTAVNMEVIVVGGFGAGTACQTRFTNCNFTNSHFGTVLNTITGFVRFYYCNWSYNYSDICGWQTGGDIKFVECTSSSPRLSTFYCPQNGNFGLDWYIDEFYFRSVPWFLVQDSASDARSPLPQGITYAFANSISWKGLNGELGGHGLINILPTDSNAGINGFLAIDQSGWETNTTASQLPSSNKFYRMDYAIVIAGQHTFYLKGGWGGCYMCGTSGLYLNTNSTSATFLMDGYWKIINFPSGGRYVTGAYHIWINDGNIAQTTISSGSTTATYTMTEAEYESNARIVPFIKVTSPGVTLPTHNVQASGATITITFSSAVTANLTLYLDTEGRRAVFS